MSGTYQAIPLQIKPPNPLEQLQQYYNIQKTSAETDTERERPAGVRATAEKTAAEAATERERPAFVQAQTAKEQLNNAVQRLVLEQKLGTLSNLPGGSNYQDPNAPQTGTSGYAAPPASYTPAGQTGLQITSGTAPATAPAPAPAPAVTEAPAPAPTPAPAETGAPGGTAPTPAPGQAAAAAPPTSPPNALGVFATQTQPVPPGSVTAPAAPAAPAASPTVAAATQGAPAAPAVPPPAAPPSPTAQAATQGAPVAPTQTTPAVSTADAVASAAPATSPQPPAIAQAATVDPNGVSRGAVNVPGVGAVPLVQYWQYREAIADTQGGGSLKATETLLGIKKTRLGQLVAAANDGASWDRNVDVAYQEGYLTNAERAHWRGKYSPQVQNDVQYQLATPEAKLAMQQEAAKQGFTYTPQGMVANPALLAAHPGRLETVEIAPGKFQKVWKTAPEVQREGQAAAEGGGVAPAAPAPQQTAPAVAAPAPQQRGAAAIPGGVPTPTAPAPAANSYVFGSSLGRGIQQASGAPGSTRDGASPDEVLTTIIRTSDAEIAGKNVALDTGSSNNTNQMQAVEQQIKELKRKGAASVTIVGVGDKKGFEGTNDKLARIASANGAKFVAVDPATLSKDRVHPNNYTGLAGAVFPSEGGAPGAPAGGAAAPPAGPDTAAVGAGGRSASYNRYLRQVAGDESGGDPNAKPRNPDGSLRSSAQTEYQFLKDTWTAQMRKSFPQLAQGKSDDELIAMQNARMADGSRLVDHVMDAHTRDNAAELQRNGIPVNGANLYLAHFLGAGGMNRVLSGDANAPVSQVALPGVVDANRHLAGMTVGDLARQAVRKYGTSPVDLAPSARDRAAASIGVGAGGGAVAPAPAPATAVAGGGAPAPATGAPTGGASALPPGTVAAEPPTLGPEAAAELEVEKARQIARAQEEEKSPYEDVTVDVTDRQGNVYPRTMSRATFRSVANDEQLAASLKGIVKLSPEQDLALQVKKVEQEGEAKGYAEQSAGIIQRGANAAQALKRLEVLDNATSLFRPGALGSERAKGMQLMTEAIRTLGGTPPKWMIEGASGAEVIGKEGGQLVADMTRLLGSNEAASVFHAVQSMNPNILLTEEGFGRMTKSLQLGLQRDRDLAQFREQWMSEGPGRQTGSIRGMQTEFDKLHSVEAYASRVVAYPLVAGLKPKPNVIYRGGNGQELMGQPDGSLAPYVAPVRGSQ